MFLGFAALRRYEAEGRRSEDLPLVHFAAQYALARVQHAFEGIYANFDAPLLGWLMRTVGSLWLRLNPVGTMPDDALSHAAALTIQSYGEQFKRLAAGAFSPPETAPGAGRLLKAFRLVTEAHPAAERIIHAQKAKKLTRGLLPAEVADEALKAGIVNADEVRLLKAALAARMEAIEVDVFTKEQFFGAADDTAPETVRRVANA
jgi:acyl-CoA dehydrogenase